MRSSKLAAAALSAIAILASALAARASGPLETAVVDDETFTGAEAALAFRRTAEAGASAARLFVNWEIVAPPPAPGSRDRPPGFDPADPADPAYRWEGVDRQVRLAAARGLEPILDVFGAPQWARARAGGSDSGPFKPSARELGNFARAIARRYGGGVAGLPRVRRWQALNEPNLPAYLTPQFEGGRPASPTLYRALVNAFADAVHGVHPDNVVVAGGLGPFTIRGTDRSSWSVGPIPFMRALLCLGPSLRPTCRAPIRFDVWAHHPYTSGGPTHSAASPDDASLGDLPRMRRILDAAARLHHVVSRRPLGFWVTEISWDSSPPDPKGVPERVLTRWVAESLFRMWSSGVSLVTWFTLRDGPYPASIYQSGLYRRGATLTRDRPKPILAAFRFPFVALPEGGRLLIWGRTPGGRTGRVAVEQAGGGGWRRLRSVRTDRYGIFSARVTTRSSGLLRARTLGRREVSAAFSPQPVADRFVNPFGSPPR